jgi:AcrR family transcriptional regulator
MTDGKRPYRLKRRAEAEAQTRLRITESAVALHGTLGPARTTVCAIATHAGVRRSTVYRHFPDETALFTACTSHWLATNPPPDLGRWSAVGDPDERLRQGLRELYAYYRRTAAMMANIHRDEETMPIVKQMMAGYRRYLAAARETLLAGRTVDPSVLRRHHAAIGHALAFPAWRSLAVEQELGDAEAAELMVALVAAAQRDPDLRPPQAQSE